MHHVVLCPDTEAAIPQKRHDHAVRNPTLGWFVKESEMVVGDPITRLVHPMLEG